MMMLLLTLTVVAGLLYQTSLANKMKAECEKRCHASLSVQQRANLCNQEEYSLGPAACSVMAKESLHLRYEDIYKLCHEASSVAPVECLLKLDSKDRNEFGFNICAKAASTIPSECFRRVLSMGKVNKKAVAKFCQSNVDHAPDLCVQAAHDHLGMKLDDAMHHCQDAVGSGDASLTSPRNTIISDCILALKDYNRNAYGLRSEDIVQFCAKINPNQYVDMVDDDNFVSFATAATDCFAQLVADMGQFSTPRLSYAHMLHICQNAPVAAGPANCTSHVVTAVTRREPHLKLSPEAIVSLCQGALSAAPGDCFAESKGLGSLEDRALLCNSAVNSGPSMCYRRATSVLKNHPEEHRALCLMADSEGPAECAAAAPHYLVAEEKVHLCTNAPVTGYNDPIKCLQAVHTYSKNFQNAPKRALGYFQENLQLDSEWTSRALLVSMCSFSDSQDPLAAAECYKSVPTSLQHDDAVRLCTNISSSHAIQHIQLCQRILPKTWSSEAISYLCEGLQTRGQTETTVKCAVELGKAMHQPHRPHEIGPGRLLDALGIAKICRTETPTQGVLRCVQRLLTLPPTATALLLPNSAATVTALCEHAHSTQPAECVHEMAKIVTSTIGFAQNMTQKLCTRPDYASILVCLSHIKHKRLWDTNDMLKCAEEKRQLTSIKVKRIYSWDDDRIEIMAGKRFALWFDVFDQWQQKYDADAADDDDASARTVLKISINENNAAGAILWGYRTNVTVAGTLYFHSLIISQPGTFEVRVSIPAAANKQREKERTLALFKLHVAEDPVAKETAPCIYVLKDGICPHDAHGPDHDAVFPQTRSYSPPLPVSPSSHGSYLHHLYCAGDKLARWGVKSFLTADGSLHVEYRSGLDAIWTGIGLPRYEMSPEQKLGLVLPSELVDQYHAWEAKGGSVQPSALNKALTRLIKRAYYRASLQWHPDRWSSAELEQYKPIVQGIFQQITEAYDACQTRWLRSNAGKGGSSDTADGTTEDGATVETPVYE